MEGEEVDRKWIRGCTVIILPRCTMYSTFGLDRLSICRSKEGVWECRTDVNHSLGRAMRSKDQNRMIHFEFEAVVDIIKVLSNYME